MSIETSITIVRPNIFPECENCPIVNNIVQSWKDFKPTIKHISSKIINIEITCIKRQKEILMLHEVDMEIKYTNIGQTLNVPGGNIEPTVVDCPHQKKYLSL